jgi:pSer/pThr/pTyr-binding forkhead associated (FHA) protein
MMQSAVRPYILDLGSTNGTFVNNERIEAERYYELLVQVGLAAPDTLMASVHLCI